MYPSLYRISKLKHCSVKDFCVKWNKGESRQNLDLWTHPLVNRDEGDFISLEAIVHSISLCQKVDHLNWTPGKRIFTTKKCRELVSGHQIGRINHWKYPWNSKFPPKICIFLWKLR